MSEKNGINYVGGWGLVTMSACVPKDMSRETIEKEVNLENPTGISSQWAITEDDFADGNPNPCPCDREPEDRLYYLLHC